MKNIIYIFITLLFASCVTENNFIKFHEKKEPLAAKNCAIWYPVTERIKESPIQYKPGDTKYIPGETEYVPVDCDSVLAEEKRTGNHIKEVKVMIPGKLRVDTLIKTVDHYLENTAYKAVLQDSITDLKKINIKQETKAAGIKHTRNILWIIIAILAAALLLKFWFKK